MKIRRKTKDCLNCGLSLSEHYNYCPRCGQENNHRIVSFGELVKDFFVNYFSFDTKFTRSVKPFLFKPGKLTLLFVEGKRASYVNPFRLYIIVSVVFFFLSTLYVKESVSKVGDSSNDKVAVDVSGAIPDEEADSTQNIGSGISAFRDILEDETLTDRQAMDSLNIIGSLTMDSTSFLTKTIFTQLRKVARQDVEIFMAYIMQNMPVMMFLLLPFYALLLKLLYIRRNVLYVKHLIHGVHLHTFTFFLLSLLLLLYLTTEHLPGLQAWVEIMVFVLLLVYIYISMFLVYHEGWFKTLLKFIILGFCYFFVLLVFGLTEAFISFLIF
jgi:hypothetical protein